MSVWCHHHTWTDLVIPESMRMKKKYQCDCSWPCDIHMNDTVYVSVIDCTVPIIALGPLQIVAVT